MLEFLAAAIRRQTGIRDYIAGEKVNQGFLAATDHFMFHTERERGGGYADICLGTKQRSGGELSRPSAPVDFLENGSGARTRKDSAGAPAGVVGPALDFDEVLSPRNGNPLPFGAVPLSPNIAVASRFHDVAHRGRVHMLAAVAVHGAVVDPVAAGDGAEGDSLQQRSVNRSSIGVGAS